MCTVIVKTGWPLTLLFVRDEYADRPWEGPGEHWPDRYPGVIGGRDLKAGGTWLALHPTAHRAAALLNGCGVTAAEATRVSRGDLALRAAATGTLPGDPPRADVPAEVSLSEADLTVYDPFFLLLVEPPGARLAGWDGERLTVTRVPDGTNMIVNAAGLDPAHPRVVANLPRFRAGDWRVPGEEAPSADPESLLVRHETPEGKILTSLSAMRVTLAAGDVTYDFTDLTAERDR
ncbi:NRDE family protein [Nonomuraea sp. NPDC005501]|uniref:NRDE family protein n=1 Tax=Nonomuraea sp. NPDC005501 TaxID=3156884 RepID=UPI0033B6A601